MNVTHVVKQRSSIDNRANIIILANAEARQMSQVREEINSELPRGGKKKKKEIDRILRTVWSLIKRERLRTGTDPFIGPRRNASYHQRVTTVLLSCKGNYTVACLRVNTR